MPGANLLWNESAPADTDVAGGGAGAIRSLETSIRNGLAAEHIWPSSTGPGFGVHLLGSARAYFDVQSNVSSTGTDGRLLVTSDTSRLFHVGSAGTLFLGGANVPSVGSAPVGGQRFYWAFEFGNDTISIGTYGQATSFPNSGFSGVPFVFLQSRDNRVIFPAAIGPTVVNVQTTANVGNLLTYAWLSTGTRTL